jgi:transcriptional regulator with XRE-family HTH domain
MTRTHSIESSPISGEMRERVQADAAQWPGSHEEWVERALADGSRKVIQRGARREWLYRLPNLRAWRTAADLRIWELAQRSGVGEKTIGQIERHNRFVRTGTASRLAKALGLENFHLIEAQYAPKPGQRAHFTDVVQMVDVDGGRGVAFFLHYISETRDQLGIALEELAARLGISARCLDDIEHARIPAAVPVVAGFAAAFDTSFASLVEF